MVLPAHSEGSSLFGVSRTSGLAYGTVVSYFNWIWIHSRKETTAAQRAGLAIGDFPVRAPRNRSLELA